MNAFGLQVLRKLSEQSSIRILFKPHPYTGYNKQGDCGAYLEKMIALCREDNPLEYIDPNESIHPYMNQSDAMITDISSVLNEYLYTLKPIFLMNAKGLSPEELISQFPSTQAAYVLGTECDILKHIDSVELDDTGFRERERIGQLCFGSFSEGALRRFLDVVEDSVR